MRAVEVASEISAIKTLCGDLDKPRSLLISKRLSVEHFGDKWTKHTFNVIMSMAKKGKTIPTYHMLSQSPQLDDEAKVLLQNTDEAYPPAKTEGDAEHLFEILDRARTSRIILQAILATEEALDPEDADPQKALIVMENALLKARNLSSDETLKVGEDSNLMEHVGKSLSKTKPDAIPTGFREFDKRCGGLPRASLTVFAASSGGGKSCMAVQIGAYAARHGFNVAIVTLEMQMEQTIHRLNSHIASVDHEALRLRTTNSMQDKRVIEQMQRWDDECKAHGARLQVLHVTDTTLSEIALQLRAFDYDLIVVDYINLLGKGDAEAESDAARLGEVARTAKLQSKVSNAAWIVLAQLNEQGEVKYSRAIQEHSDILWSWTYGDAERATGQVEVKQRKNRNSETFPFFLKANFKIQTFENAGSDESNQEAPGLPKKKKKVERLPTAKPMPGLGVGDDEEDL